MNEKLIKQLQEGKIAVKNDSTLEKLAKVLNYAFPKDTPMRLRGEFKFYQLDMPGFWKAMRSVSIPFYSVEEFLEEEFVLPKKWFLLRTITNSEIINKWINDTFYNGQIRAFSDCNAYIYSDRSYSSLTIASYTEITFEQFKKYVLKEATMEKISVEKLKKDQEYVVYIDSEKEWKELSNLCGFDVASKYHGQYCYSPYNNTFSSTSTKTFPGSYKYNYKQSKIITISQIKKEIMEKKLIGYRLIKPEYKEATRIIANQKTDYTKEFFTPGSTTHDRFNNAGVLDLWFEPVYEEEIKLPTINGYEGKVEDDYIVYGNNCARFHKAFFRDLLEINNYKGNRTIAKVTLSSNVIITIEEIEKIVVYLNAKGL